MKISGDTVTVVLSPKFASNCDEEANGKPREPVVTITQFEGGGTVIHIGPPFETGSIGRRTTSENVTAESSCV